MTSSGLQPGLRERRYGAIPAEDLPLSAASILFGCGRTAATAFKAAQSLTFFLGRCSCNSRLRLGKSALQTDHMGLFRLFPVSGIAP